MANPQFAAPTPMDLRSSMGRFTTGVAVVSADDGTGEPCGMTISSLGSISLDPPILLISLTHGSRTTDAVEHAGAFSVSVLSSRQEAIARRFATRGGARFEGMPFVTSPSGLPVIKDALAIFDCVVHSAHDIGDHRVFYGSIIDLQWRDGTGLAFYAGKFGDFHDFGHDEMPWLF
ncbi:flavin reductase family protein [Hoyosella sp. YIM 151337]|uniref:flavin reductase family protein n=1 Tax=Hoyosella sp. YIM 151337 TaxID=2992742 RepID=UPI00223564B1|nr:flavin reductase family protein [Hoyosella sp. YIM 151337]MCW4354131.1 flavin reductase family protein [Hoyosella sp. YIM 151337]